MKRFNKFILGDKSIVLAPQVHKQSVIWIHGLGDTAHGFLDVFEEMNITKDHTKIILTNAPQRKVTCNQGMFQTSWFDIKSFEFRLDQKFEDCVSIKEINDSAQILKKYIDEEAVLVGAENVFIGGFSQGCCMSLYVGLSYPKKLAGIIGVAGFLFPITQPSEESKQTPILLFNGEMDQLINFKMAQESFKALDNNQRQIFQKHTDQHTAHEFNMNVVNIVKKFFEATQ
ncbi:hypothetical protein pb186bvf_000680 [Paramecium bursaria]